MVASLGQLGRTYSTSFWLWGVLNQTDLECHTFPCFHYTRRTHSGVSKSSKSVLWASLYRKKESLSYTQANSLLWDVYRRSGGFWRYY